MTDPAAHTPSDSAGAPDVDTLAETVRKALIRSFDVRGNGVLHPNDVAILDALSDLAATARRVAELELAFHNECAKNDELAWKRDEADREATDAATRVAELDAALRSIQAVAVMTHSEHARAHRLDWLREIENRARAALAGDGGGA